MIVIALCANDNCLAWAVATIWRPKSLCFTCLH